MTDPKPKSAFYDLSEELLLLILDQLKPADDCTPDPRLHFADFKNLRLSHSRFAYNRHVYKELFRAVYLDASVSHLDSRALRTIGPYVETVSFRASGCLHTDTYLPKPLSSMQTAAEEASISKLQEFIESGRALMDWTDALRHMPNATCFNISGPYFSGDDYRSRLINIPWLATCAMSAAGIAPKKLGCGAHQSSDVRDSVAWWSELDASCMETLGVSGWLEDSSGYLECLLPRCASTLKTLNFIFTGRAIWRGLKIPPMPCLERLNVGPGRVDPSKIATLVETSPRLVDMFVFSTEHMGRGTLEEWRPLFDALRRAPRCIQLDLSGFIMLAGSKFVRLKHGTKDEPKIETFQDEDEIPSRRGGKNRRFNEVAFRLARYISGFADWELQQWEGRP